MTTSETARPARKTTSAVLHWYDFVCPFCYVGQDRSAILVSRGFTVTNLPYRIHPEIPLGGIEAGPRKGPMYTFVEEAARAAGLPLHWPSRLPSTGYALTAAEWVRRHRPAAFPALQAALFQAHFVLGQDIGDPEVVIARGVDCGVDPAELSAALSTPEPARAVAESEEAARRAGVTGTPAWLVGSQLIEGLRTRALFEEIAATPA